MKKNFFKIFVAVAVMALMTACSGGGLNGLISDYEKACKAGDVAKAHQIEAELEEKYSIEDLNEDQMARLTTAAMSLYLNQAGDINIDDLDDAYEDAEEYLNGAYDEAEEYVNDAYKQAEEYMNDAYEQAGDLYKDAQKQANDMYEEAQKKANDMYNDAMKQAEDMMNAYGF